MLSGVPRVNRLPHATKACLAPHTDTTRLKQIWTKAGKTIYYVEMRRKQWTSLARNFAG